MKIDLCLYENENTGMLEPLALTRPVFSLLCGTKNLFEKIRDYQLKVTKIEKRFNDNFNNFRVENKNIKN